jgi:hypothetical protein
MTTTTQVPAVFDLSPSGSVNSTSASVFSGVLDLRSALSALLTFSANVGASAPTTQCQVNILYYHTTSATPPSAAAANTGATGWKNLYSVGSGIVANTKNRQAVMCVWNLQHLRQTQLSAKPLPPLSRLHRASKWPT